MRGSTKIDRQRRVLELIVKYHIGTTEPIGSRLIANNMGLSSATIRNIMYELEEQGFIRQPHASAGRIPTDRGYRVYVDSLLELKDLLDLDEGDADEMIYHLRANSIEDVLLKGLQLCSKVTSQACLALLPALKIRERLIERLEERLKGMLTSLYDFEDRLYLDGTHYLVEQPEFKDIGKISAVLKILEDKRGLLEILEENITSDGIKIYIGSENRTLGFDECTIITANYNLENDITGTLGIIGPMRMEYRKVIPAVNCIAGSISRLFNEMV
jgi:heat-inducible transcriptional repressor